MSCCLFFFVVVFQTAFNAENMGHHFACVNIHYANTPMQYTSIFHGCKNVHFQKNFLNIFLIFAQNIDCGYTLEPPQCMYVVYHGVSVCMCILV